MAYRRTGTAWSLELLPSYMDSKILQGGGKRSLWPTRMRTLRHSLDAHFSEGSEGSSERGGEENA